MAPGMTRDLTICTVAAKDRTQVQIQSTSNYSMYYNLQQSLAAALVHVCRN